MARFAWLVALAAGAASPALATNGQSVSAVQKVIQMLQDMSAKTKQEKKDEEVEFAKFQTWCTQEGARLKSEVTKNGETIELLSANINKLTTDIRTHGERIATLSQEVAGHEADIKAEEAQRAKDHEAYLVESTDFAESVDALDRAIQILKREDYDRPGSADSLLQLAKNDRMPAKVRSIVAAFVGMAGEGKDSPLGGMDYSAPEANAYEFQSGSIIELLKRLQDDFRSKLAESQKAEMNSKHASAMIVQDLTDSVENKKQEIDETKLVKERKTEELAKDKKELADTETQKAANEKTLSEVTTECREKSMSFQEKQQLRAEEIEAIAKAVEILSSPDVMGNAEKHLAFAQAKSKASQALLQVAGMDGAERSEGIRRRVREFLESEGKRLHSDQISMLAQQMGADPFGKVKKMIDAMITRLLEEANQDAQHEGFCDTEMGKNKVTRTKLSEDIDGLSAAIETGKSAIASLKDETAELSAEVAQLEKAMGEATDLRNAENAKNKETITDAQAAQKAVAAATAVLKDFYERASTATGFVQQSAGAPQPRAYGLKTGVKMGSEEWDSLANPDFEASVTQGKEGKVDRGHKEGMQTFGEVEKGQQDEAQYGVLGLLEIILSDFANLEADTNAAEAAAAEAYERYMVESKRSKASMSKEIELNNADQATAEAKLQEDTADLKATQDELLAADRVYKNLVPQCIDQGMTWDERVAARQAEINSLKEALKLLSQSDIA